MRTGESLTASERVQRLQTALHAKAKEALGFRFYSLSDKMWRDDVLLPSGVVVGRLNRLLTGWANYFILGQVRPAYKAIDQHATRRLRQWLCRKHKVRIGKHVRFPSERLWSDYGLTHLAPRTASFPWAKA